MKIHLDKLTQTIDSIKIPQYKIFKFSDTRILFILFILFPVILYYLYYMYEESQSDLLIISFIFFLNWIIFISFLSDRFTKIAKANLEDFLNTCQNIKEKAIEIIIEYELFLKHINNDYESKSILIEDLDTIKNTIEKITQEIILFEKMISNLEPEKGKYIISEMKDIILNQSKLIKWEAIKFISVTKTEISSNIKKWLEIHKEKLQELEKQLWNQWTKTENNQWKFALEAQKMRFQSYIQSINNLVK